MWMASSNMNCTDQVKAESAWAIQFKPLSSNAIHTWRLVQWFEQFEQALMVSEAAAQFFHAKFDPLHQDIVIPPVLLHPNPKLPMIKRRYGGCWQDWRKRPDAEVRVERGVWWTISYFCYLWQPSHTKATWESVLPWRSHNVTRTYKNILWKYLCVFVISFHITFS